MSTGLPDTTVTVETDVLVIGGGPAGLTAAAQLAAHRPGRVLVAEREKWAGGIPRHSNHLGFGLRDLHRFLTGPSYARRLVGQATDAGADIRPETLATGWTADGLAEVTSPHGRYRIAAQATILATGARERPRSARLVAGDRPPGVYTTGQLQNLVHLHHGTPGRRAVVVGAELVSWSAVLTLRDAGCRTVLMTTPHPTPESYAMLNFAGRLALHVPMATNTRVLQVIGREAVRAVEIEDRSSGRRRTAECDVVVFTGDWIPDHELVRLAGIQLDPQTLGPSVDGALRTSQPGTFAAGNLIHPVDTADMAGIDGQLVAASVTAYLEGRRPLSASTSIVAEEPFRWVSPNVLSADRPRPPRGRLLLWTDELVRRPHISVRQDGREIADRRLPWPASPGRIFRVPSSILATADPSAGDVHVCLR